MTMQLKTYNETLHDEFENLIDDLREKVMRNLKNAKHKYHVNYELTQCLKWPLNNPHYTHYTYQGCDYVDLILGLRDPYVTILGNPNPEYLLEQCLLKFHQGDERRYLLMNDITCTPVERCGIELLDHPKMRVYDLKKCLKWNGQKGYSK